MSKTTDDLIKIAFAGGGMYLSAKKSTDDLIKIAHAASDKGARIIISESSQKTTDQLIQIAHAGQGCVLFDLTN